MVVLKAEECRDGFGLRYGWVQESVQWCVVFVSVSLSSLFLFGFIPQAGSIHPGFWTWVLIFAQLTRLGWAVQHFWSYLQQNQVSACWPVSVFPLQLIWASLWAPTKALWLLPSAMLRVTSYLFPILLLWGHQHDLAPPRHLPCSHCRLCPPIF